jgi:hypothetical protein
MLCLPVAGKSKRGPQNPVEYRAGKRCVTSKKGRPFKPGQSGNPGGRPRAAGDIIELARQKTPEAIETLTDIMVNGRQEAARVRAAEVLLDRAHGRPLQTQQVLEMTTDKRAEDLTDAELMAIARQGLPKTKEEQHPATSSWNGGDDTTH